MWSQEILYSERQLTFWLLAICSLATTMVLLKHFNNYIYILKTNIILTCLLT